MFLLLGYITLPAGREWPLSNKLRGFKQIYTDRQLIILESLPTCLHLQLKNSQSQLTHPILATSISP